MSNRTKKLIAAFSLFLSFVTPQFVNAQEPPPMPMARPMPRPMYPADVAGRWTIYAKGPTGQRDTKSIIVRQNGNSIGGFFRGPYQSGHLQGTINQQHIVFRTLTREQLVFRGRVQGNTITGTFHTRRGTGTFQAVRG